MDVGDLWFVGGTLVFFAVCVAYIRGLDHIVRSAEKADATHEQLAEEAVAPDAVTS